MSDRVPAFTGEVHPVADLFPMMPDDRLKDLSESIQINGLLNPIVLDRHGTLLDGRNRLKGCQLAEVPPQFTLYEGNPVLFILAQNLDRRELSQGQKAMAIALAHRVALETGVTTNFPALEGRRDQNWSLRQLARGRCVGREYVRQAAFVVEHARAQADVVLAGGKELHLAFQEAQRRKEEAESDAAKFAELQTACPELAVMVQEGDMTLPMAIAAWKEKERAEKQRIAILTSHFDSVLSHAAPNTDDHIEARAREWLEANPKLVGGEPDFSPTRARRAAATLLEYARLKEEQYATEQDRDRQDRRGD